MNGEKFMDQARVFGAVSAIALGIFAVGREIDQPDTDGCDSTLTNPASWVFCPIIDAGRKINETVFDGLSSGLEDVPVEPKKDN